MALVVETGAGIVGAESYATEAAADTFWANRTQSALSATWTAATTAIKEGCLREATEFLDAKYGQFYLGDRAGYVQGLLWPRTGAYDDAGYPLPDLPSELVRAVYELAGRAVSERLATDEDRGGMVKRAKAGSVEVEYMDGASADKTFGIVDGLLTPILNGLQGGAPSWNWR